MIKRIAKWIREFFANYIWFQKKLREKYSLGQCILLNFQFLWCVVTDGCSPEEYLWFEFYHKNRQERKTFLTYLRHAKLQRRYNSKRVRNILNDKQKFNEFFKKELGREWLDADSADADEIEQFLKKHQIVMVKPKSQIPPAQRLSTHPSEIPIRSPAANTSALPLMQNVPIRSVFTTFGLNSCNSLCCWIHSSRRHPENIVSSVFSPL